MTLTVNGSESPVLAVRGGASCSDRHACLQQQLVCGDGIACMHSRAFSQGFAVEQAYLGVKPALHMGGCIFVLRHVYWHVIGILR